MFQQVKYICHLNFERIDIFILFVIDIWQKTECLLTS